jgi:hypothetical protein
MRVIGGLLIALAAIGFVAGGSSIRKLPNHDQFIFQAMGIMTVPFIMLFIGAVLLERAKQKPPI